MTPLTTPSTLTSTSTSQQGQHTGPLRRATYVHVSDLTSAYNIDHVQLEREMARVNANRNKLRDSTADAASSDNNVLEKNRIATEEASSDGNSDGVPVPDEDVTDLETTLGPIVPQKRLQPPRGGFNLCVLVGKINLVVDKMRVDQSRVRLAEVEIGDETGTVTLRARNEEIDLLERVSKSKLGAVVLRNCTLELYQGKHIRLAVTKWGKLTEYPDNVASTPGPPPTMNTDRNFSFIDLSIVASEIVEKTQSESFAPYTTTTTTTTSRQTKQSTESEAKAGGFASSSKSSVLSSKPAKSNTKSHQQQPQTLRRSNRLSSSEQQRRQARSAHYGGMKTETNQPPPRSGQIVYQGIQQGYHGYGEQQNMDTRMRQQQYPHAAYAHSHSHSTRQQDAVSAQVALQQQFEMQQRQLHQLYSREQNRHVGQVRQQQQSSPMLLSPINSFDASSGYYAGDISMPGVGNNPILVQPPSEHYSSPKMESISGLQQDGCHNGAQQHPSLNPMSSYQIGKMNPEATSFAPSYLSAAQGSSPQQVPCPSQFPPYGDISQPFPGASIYPPQLQSGHHPSFYVPAGISPGGYAHHTPPPPPQTTSFNAPLEQHDEKNGTTTTTTTTTNSQHHNYQYPPTTAESASMGKENVTSRPSHG